MKGNRAVGLIGQREVQNSMSKVLEGWLRMLSSKSVECEQRRCSSFWKLEFFCKIFLFLFFFMRTGRPDVTVESLTCVAFIFCC